MKRIENRPEIIDEEILCYDNVPVAVAAAYIGMGKTSLRYALQDRWALPVRVQRGARKSKP
jgi:hypothetical protein